jgi:hypothetical protein
MPLWMGVIMVCSLSFVLVMDCIRLYHMFRDGE